MLPKFKIMSHTIKRILVPVDFSDTSETALNQAFMLARLLKAELLLLHIISDSTFKFIGARDLKDVLPSTEDIEVKAKEKFEQLTREIQKKYPIQPNVFIEHGVVHDVIVEFANKNKIDLIIMGTHGVSGYKELFMGSNAQRVVTLSKLPVLTIQQESKTVGFKNILIPIDNSLHSREKVNIAAKIAQIYKSKVHILGLPGSDEKEEIGKFKVKLKSVEKIFGAEQLSYTTTIESGANLANAALGYAEKNKCDLIVINTGHESEITGIFLGAFAQQLVNHSPVPVLSLEHSEDQYSISVPGFGV